MARTSRSIGGGRRRDADGLVAELGYHYPQSEFPYRRLREENARRSRQEPEFELIDTGAFDDRYWQIVVDYAKAAPRDLCVRIEIRNAGPEAAELHVLPTLWFRNRWSWGDDFQRPSIKAASAGPGEAGKGYRRGCRPQGDGVWSRGPIQLDASQNSSSATTRQMWPACSGSPLDRHSRRMASTITSPLGRRQ